MTGLFFYNKQGFYFSLISVTPCDETMCSVYGYKSEQYNLVRTSRFIRYHHFFSFSYNIPAINVSPFFDKIFYNFEHSLGTTIMEWSAHAVIHTFQCLLFEVQKQLDA